MMLLLCSRHGSHGRGRGRVAEGCAHDGLEGGGGRGHLRAGVADQRGVPLVLLLRRAAAGLLLLILVLHGERGIKLHRGLRLWSGFGIS